MKIKKIIAIIVVALFFAAIILFYTKMNKTQMNFHEMKGYKDAILVDFMHIPDLVVLNEKEEPYDFMFDAEKLTQKLNNDFEDKLLKEFNLSKVSYHIHILDTQTGAYWDFKNYIPLDPIYDIDENEKNLVWRYANIKYPDGNISTVLVRAVFVVGEDENRNKLKQGMICNSDLECVSSHCTNGSGRGQKYKTCQASYCSYSREDDVKVKHFCECISQKTKTCSSSITKICCDTSNEPLRLIEGQPCEFNSDCRSGVCRHFFCD
ncbi:MAG: hypothetical protein B6U87_00150 [Candidatus Aenigmarchaeota archaeon ex4484_52]|nr:MAG: hypothetical protein B6U87_00150 [Candidatus Aenigmarchaeota archaeon ex4484_52]